MDLGAFSVAIRTLSNKAELPGSSLLHIRDDDMRILGVDAASDRIAILDRVLDVILAYHRLDSTSASYRRRVSAPSWIEQPRRVSRSHTGDCAYSDIQRTSRVDEHFVTGDGTF
jgi:hypothetical protein